MTNKISPELEKLKAYSKNDIIAAIGACVNPGMITAMILKNMRHVTVTNAVNEHKAATKTLKAAQEAYIKFREELRTNYATLMDVPPEVLSRGVKLEQALNRAEDCVRKLDQKIKELLDGGENV